MSSAYSQKPPLRVACVLGWEDSALPLVNTRVNIFGDPATLDHIEELVGHDGGQSLTQ